MLELLVGGFALVVVIAVLGFVLGLLSLVGALIALPLKILGFAFKALGALIALPFLLLGGTAVALVLGVGLVLAVGAGLLALLTPLLPLFLVGWGIWWLARRKPATA